MRKRALGYSLIIIGLIAIFLKPITSITGFSVQTEALSAVKDIWFWFIGMGMILAGGLIMTRAYYEPQLSDELRSYMRKKGTLNQFLNDYRQMCTNFMPEKIRIPKKEEGYVSREKMLASEKKVLEKLGKSYAEALTSVLELGYRLDKEKADYALIGGIGVLGHLYEHSKKFGLRFRGTEDIDLLSDRNLNPIYRQLGFRKIPPEMINPKSLPPGTKIESYIRENPRAPDKHIKIQQRNAISFGGGEKDESPEVYAGSKLVEFYGVPIRVASNRDLRATKTGIRTRKDKLGHLKDEHDIRHLELIEELNRCKEIKQKSSKKIGQP